MELYWKNTDTNLPTCNQIYENNKHLSPCGKWAFQEAFPCLNVASHVLWYPAVYSWKTCIHIFRIYRLPYLCLYFTDEKVNNMYILLSVLIKWFIDSTNILLNAFGSLGTGHVAKDVSLKKAWPLLCGGKGIVSAEAITTNYYSDAIYIPVPLLPGTNVAFCLKKINGFIYSLAHVCLPLCYRHVRSVLEICVPYKMLMEPWFLEMR